MINCQVGVHLKEEVMVVAYKGGQSMLTSYLIGKMVERSLAFVVIETGEQERKIEIPYHNVILIEELED